MEYFSILVALAIIAGVCLLIFAGRETILNIREARDARLVLARLDAYLTLGNHNQKELGHRVSPNPERNTQGKK
jgi:hypothetical protein